MPRRNEDEADGRVYNFGAVGLLPPGYSVVWRKTLKAYQGTGPDGWTSAPTDDPFEARFLCLEHGLPAAVAIWDRWYSKMIRRGLSTRPDPHKYVLLARLWKSPAYRREAAPQ